MSSASSPIARSPSREPRAEAQFALGANACYAVAVSALLAAITRWQFTLGTLILFGYILIWTGTAIASISGRRTLALLAMALTTIALLPVAFQWMRRVAFVVKYGGMDCYTCQSSPMPFLFHWCIESAVLFPGLACVALLATTCVRKVNHAS